MDADRPPSDPERTSEDDGLDDSGDSTVVPAVVAVVVAEGSVPHLERCLGALAESDYPDLTVLVIAATDEDLTPRVAAVMPKAFVRPVAARGVAAGSNEAMATVAGAPFLLFLHPDTVCDPPAIRLLVEEAYRSNAAIVGPKVVDVDNPEILREVGWSVDRFGVPHSDIERDELDQEQHDAVRDVFFVRDVCMLVRADLFGELGGFDVACDPGARTLDLCWRARLAAARIIVAPDARVRHFEADGPREADQRLAYRHQVRALLTSTSSWRLLAIVPAAVLLQFGEAFVFLIRRRRDRAAVLAGAWTWNFRNLGSTLRARREAQARRVVSDREIHALQFRGSARVTGYMATSLHAEDRVRALSARGRSVAGSASMKFRSARGLMVVAFLAVVLVGTRDLLLGRLAAVGEFAPWPGVGALLRAFTSEWRFADLGAHAPAPPMLALTAGMRVLALGAGGFARSAFVSLAIPVAAWGAYRAGRAIAGAGWPAAVAAVAYGIVPIPRNAIAAGHLGALVLYAMAPLVLLAVVQLGGLVPVRWPRRRVSVLGALAVVIAAAWWPLAVLFPFVVVVGIAVAAPLTRDAPSRLAAVARGAGVVSGLALVLLFPWPLGFLTAGDRAGALGIVADPVASVGALLRLVTGPNGHGIGPWAFLVVALVVTLMASGDRGRWCLRLWGVALVGWTLALLPVWSGTTSPDPDGVLVPAALALALIAGIGVATFLEEVRRHHLGWRHAASAAAALGMGLAALTFVGDAGGGRWRQPSSDWNQTLSWMQLQQDRGPFRVLWLGRPDVVPSSIHRSGAAAFAFTNDGPGAVGDLLPPPGGDGFRAARDAVEQLQRESTNRFGRLVSTMAVRYIAVPDRPDPGPSPGHDSGLSVALSRQLDLRQVEVADGLTLFENTAWTPRGAPKVGTYVWSQQYDDAWRARSAGHDLAHRRIDGWTNGYRVVGAGPVAVRFERQWWRWPMLAVELALVLLLARRALRRGRSGTRRRQRAAARTAAVDAADAGDAVVGS